VLDVSSGVRLYVAMRGGGDSLRIRGIRWVCCANSADARRGKKLRKQTPGKLRTCTAAPFTSAKAATKAKKIITNDDIKSSPASGFGGVFYVSAGAINNCDSMCFNQLRGNAWPGGKENPNWRRDILQQLDFVRSDSEWQGYLHELYRAHDAICQLTFEKQDEMRRSGSTRNLGPQEIAIADKYDDKISTTQATLTSAVARESELRQRFAGKPIANGFAMTQGVRMQGGFCSQSKVIFLP
jgi:hypothetical protein